MPNDDDSLRNERCKMLNDNTETPKKSKAYDSKHEVETEMHKLKAKISW